jgi:membrane protein YdbS with pleckstrin-like domain
LRDPRCVAEVEKRRVIHVHVDHGTTTVAFAQRHVRLWCTDEGLPTFVHFVLPVEFVNYAVIFFVYLQNSEVVATEVCTWSVLFVNKLETIPLILRLTNWVASVVW